ncbi:MAG: hypothetical protein EOO85_09145 [Pedobacter sp.]|nr:MAG: hypothetical protein EOO85_09145 [Pedobacter sp.]
MKDLAVADSRISRAGDIITELEHSDLRDESPVFLHCATYAPGRAGGLVRHVAADATAGELSSILPPDGHDFLKGSCVALVSADHLIFCGDNMKPEALRYFLHELAKARGRPAYETTYDFAPVANKEVLRQVQSVGVKSIGIDATLDEFDPTGQLFETIGGNLKNEVLNALRGIWEKDPKFSHLRDEDFHNVNAKIILTLDKRHSKGVTQEAFDDAAQRTLDSQEPGFYLRTRDDAVISYSSIKLVKTVELPVQHETIDYQEAWSAMEIYFDDLRSRGYLA